MCGRFVLSSKNKIKLEYNVDIVPNYNITPGENVLVIDNNSEVKRMKWGFTPHWSKTLNIINARIETLFDKPAFKGSLRCIFIANGYFEWKEENNFKQPYYHHLNDNLLYFAGIFNLNSGSCIVTVHSQEHISHIHKRQPLILKKEYINDWLLDKYDLKFQISDRLNYVRVNRLVNNPKNNSRINIEFYNEF